MFILYLPALAFLAALALGGRPGRLAGVRLRWAPILVMAMLVQGPLFGPLGELLPSGDRIGLGLYLASSLAALAVVVANRALPGLRVLAAGAVLNLVAIASNGGTMPASPAALASLGWGDPAVDFSNSALVAAPAFPWLTDVFAMPAWLPFANIFSVGDALIAVGAAWFVIRAMLGTPAREPARDDAAEPRSGRPSSAQPAVGEPSAFPS